MEVTQKIDDDEITNITEQFKLEFHQLKAYYNFRLNFKKKLREGINKKDEIRYCLIDKKWIHEWKKHVGYNHICQNRIDNGMSHQELNDFDYKSIVPYFIIFSNKYTIFPFDNKDIYNNGEINPLSDFIIVDQNSYNSFVTIGNNLSNEKYRSFSIIFFKEKLLLKFNYYKYLLMFKFSRVNENEIYWELILIFSEQMNENTIINNFFYLNIIQWLNENQFDLGSTNEKDITLNQYKVKLINKTLLINKGKTSSNAQLKNDIMQIIELNNPINHINGNNPTHMNKIDNVNNFTNKLHNNKAITTSSSERNIFNITNNDNMNNMNNSVPEINTNLVFYKKQNKNNGIEKNGKVKTIDKNLSLKYPHRTGLKNIGQTSYLNSTIQCLSNIKYLSNYLMKHYSQFDMEKYPLFVSFSSLVFDLFNTKNKYVSPEIFKKIIGKLNPSFEGMHEADPKDLIFFIFETLHQELNKAKNSPQSNINSNINEKDSFNENKALQNFINDFSNNNKSIISDTFYGTIRSTEKCNICKKIKYSFKTFNLLIFQLKNIKEFFQNTNNNFNYDLTIYDAFEYDKKEEILEGDNMIYCNYCKALTSSTRQKVIYSLPRVMIIILNRGINNKDFNEEFILADQLDLSIQNFIINNEINSKFYLQSIITLIGETNSNGYYIAYCRNGPNENFLCYNNTKVSKANIYEAMSSNISVNEYEKITPYILVYHHIN